MKKLFSIIILFLYTGVLFAVQNQPEDIKNKQNNDLNSNQENGTDKDSSKEKIVNGNDTENDKIKNNTSSKETAGKNNDSKEKNDAASLNKDSDYEKEKKKTDWIINTINNGTHKERKNAINYVLTIKDSELKKLLGNKIIEIIKNEAELEVRIKAITISGEMLLKEAVPDLINLLNDESEDIVTAAVYAIKKIKDLSAKQALSEKLKQQKLENHSVLTEALIDTLGEFKAVELIDFAVKTIKEPSTHQITRELLVLFLGKIGSKDSREILVGLLKDEDENEQIRAFAANSLANLDIRDSSADIEKVMLNIESYSFNKKKNYNNLYIYCIAALAKLGNESALPRLINAMRSDNASVRLKAVNLAKELKDKRTVDILKYKRDYDPSAKVQAAAKEALKELGIEQDKSEIRKNKKPEKEEPVDETGTGELNS